MIIFTQKEETHLSFHILDHIPSVSVLNVFLHHWETY